MKQRIATILLETFIDLGITILYAVIAGFLIVGIVVSDDGPISVASSLLYAGLLPAMVVILIGVDIVLRIIDEWTEHRRRHAETGTNALACPHGPRFSC